MKPTEFLQGVVDGVTQFLQNYLRFILLSLRRPFHEAGRQYFRSEQAAERDISPLSYLFTSIVIASLLHVNLLTLGDFRIHDALNGIVRNASNDALFPTLVGALIMTIAFDFTLYIVHRGGMRGLRRAKRLYKVTLLAAASAVLWSHVAFIAGSLLGWCLLLFTPPFGWIVAKWAFTRPAVIDIILSYFAFSVGMLAAFIVSYVMLLPLSRYRAASRHSTTRRSPRAAVYLYPAFIGLLLLSFRAIRITVANDLSGRIEAVQVECGIRNTGQPMRGIIVIRNASSSDQLLYLDNWTLTVETAVFENAFPPQQDSRPGQSPLIIDGKPNQDPIILKTGEAKLLHYVTTLNYAKNIDRRHMPDDDGQECPLTMSPGHPL